MNAILSLITCFAMLLTGTAALPAQPETAQVLTIDNITVWDDDEVVTLNPSVVLTTQPGSEKTDFHFEIRDANGETRLPMSASFDQDGVTYELNGENAYYIDAATIDSAASTDVTVNGISTGDEEMPQAYTDLLTAAQALAEMAEDPQADEEMSAQLSAFAEELFADDFTETQIEVNGEQYDGVSGDINLFSGDVFTLLDRICTMDNAMGAYFNALLAFANYASETEYASFSDVYADMTGELGEEAVLPVHIELVDSDDMQHTGLSMSYTDEDGAEMDINCSTTVVGNDTEVAFDMTMLDEESTAGVNFSLSRTDALVSVSGEVNLNEVQILTATDADSEAEVSGSTRDSSFIFGYSKVNVDDSTSTQEFTITFDTVFDKGTAYESAGHYDLRGERNVSPEDGGSLAEQTISLTVDDNTLGLSYNAHRAEAPAQDFFEGKTIVDMERADAQNLMNDDVYAMSNDMTALTTDGSVLKLISFLSDLDLYGTDYADDYDTDDSYGYDDDYDDGYDLSSQSDDGDYGSTQVETLEEAAAIFTGTMPEYTAPEGYGIESIQADEETLCIRYEGENLPEYELSTYAYSYASDDEVYTYKDGALTALDGHLVQISFFDDGNIYSVTVSNAQGDAIYFYFYDDATMDDVNTILSGLN